MSTESLETTIRATLGEDVFNSPIIQVLIQKFKNYDNLVSGEVEEVLKSLDEIEASHLQSHKDSNNIGDFNLWFAEHYMNIKAFILAQAKEISELKKKVKIVELYDEVEEMQEKMKLAKKENTLNIDKLREIVLPFKEKYNLEDHIAIGIAEKSYSFKKIKKLCKGADK